MSMAAHQLAPSSARGVLIEGYASLFGILDQAGDRVRAGAFAQALRGGNIPMLLQHKPGAIVGRWSRVVEDGRGLFVRGLVERSAARTLVRNGLTGLSIGFRPLVWAPEAGGGRTLIKLDLVEISLVTDPMLDEARFRVVSE